MSYNKVLQGSYLGKRIREDREFIFPTVVGPKCIENSTTFKSEKNKQDSGMEQKLRWKSCFAISLSEKKYTAKITIHNLDICV